MRKHINILALTVAATVLFGCGGNGSSGTTTTGRTGGNFAGTWSGSDDETLTYQGQSGSGTAQITVVISSSGAVSGSWGGTGTNGSFSGTINSNGQTNLTVNSSANGLTDVSYISGTLTKNGTNLSGTLNGTFNNSDGISGTETDQFQLTYQGQPVKGTVQPSVKTSRLVGPNAMLSILSVEKQ